MKILKMVFLFIMSIYMNQSYSNVVNIIEQKKWIHGSKDCSVNTDPAIDILKIDNATYILRQNKCTHFEAPFIYVLFGKHKVFVQDTGAVEDENVFPLRKTLDTLITSWKKKHNIKNIDVIVTHSHSHSDHHAGDKQFHGVEIYTVVKPERNAVRDFFGFKNWPESSSELDLGGRKLTIIPIPGHQEDSVAIYDRKARILLTGDTFYPGRLYIKEWEVFKRSIQKLVDFTKNNPVSALLGTHIEMTTEPGVDFSMGATWQPNEASLILTVNDLIELNKVLIDLGDMPQKKSLRKMIVYPI